MVYSLSGVKVRECLSLFLIFAKFGPGGPKNGHFWPFFGHFRSFSDLEIFLVNEIFWFFNMMFFGMFRSDFQKIVKKGSKFGPPGPKNNHFAPFVRLEFFSSEWFFLIFYHMMFLGIFRSDQFLKKGQILKNWKNDFKYHKISMKFGPLFCYKMLQSFVNKRFIELITRKTWCYCRKH